MQEARHTGFIAHCEEVKVADPKRREALAYDAHLFVQREAVRLQSVRPNDKSLPYIVDLHKHIQENDDINAITTYIFNSIFCVDILASPTSFHGT